MTARTTSTGYDDVLEFLVASGRRIKEHAGQLPDLGVTKRFLTEEDLRIERELGALIGRRFPGEDFVAEEEHDRTAHGNVHWVCDPISGTRTFLAGLASYGLVVARVVGTEPVFAAVYDPTMDELFEARAGAGARCNGRTLKVTSEAGQDGPRVHYNLTYEYRDPAEERRLYEGLTAFDLYRNTNSFGVNYCHVAAGRYDGFVALTKDAFPEVAGALVLREAGGVFESFSGERVVERGERRFLGGAPWCAEQLRKVVADRAS